MEDISESTGIHKLQKVFLALLPHIPEPVCRNWLHTHQADSARQLARTFKIWDSAAAFAWVRYTEDWERGL